MEDFEKQLKEEELAKVTEESQQTYTDKDGTVMEWNAEKKAWFPKIDDDFIANYQMNYGNSQNSDNADNNTDNNADNNTDKSQTQPYDAEAYEKYCEDYYKYYGVRPDNTQQTDEHSNINPETGQPFKDTAEYYAYYYGEEYAEYYKDFQQDDVSTPGSNQTIKNLSNKDKKKLQAEEKRKAAGEKRKAAPEKEEPTWFNYETDEGTHVYVSGLPDDITEEEFQELMSKYGLIMYDPFKKKPKLKLYKDSEGNMKGDGLCCYIKIESVDLALNLLDGLDYKGKKVHVERAQFEMKGQFDPSKKKKKLSNKQKRKMKESQEKLFEWKLDKPSDVRLKHEKTVILKNMFNITDFKTDLSLINELREDVRTECNKFGEVKKVTLFDRNVEGVMSVAYKTAEEADECIKALNGRWFASKQIHAETWDGKTKYDVEETEEEKAERLKTWNTYLESTDAQPTSSSATDITDSQATASVNMDSADDQPTSSSSKDEADSQTAASNIASADDQPTSSSSNKTTTSQASASVNMDITDDQPTSSSSNKKTNSQASASVNIDSDNLTIENRIDSSTGKNTDVTSNTVENNSAVTTSEVITNSDAQTDEN